MLRIIRAFIILLLSPSVRIYIGFLSFKNRLKTLGKPTKKHFEKSYDGQNIMVLALYQKGRLRPDTVRLLQHAKTQNIYVIAVNTLKLKDPDSITDLVDCYYEKPNFGRDFSSYQTGFLHVFNNRMHEGCPRLMMINDSIFFSDERMPKFLQDMMDTKYEVLGSTENFDIEYHLGSFCIAMSQSILRHPKFQRYWRSYRLSDVRPTVIKRGELALSKLLKSVMQNPSELTALYSAHRFFETVEPDEKMIDFVIRNARASGVFAWKRVDPRQIAKSYRESYLEGLLDREEETQISLDIADTDQLKNWQLRSLKDIETYLTDSLLVGGQKIDKLALHEAALKEIIESFMSGSQIHQNAAVLLNMGLPIVKLDGLYRGIFDMSDVYRVTQLLPEEEGMELRALLMSRPYGRRYYVGWRQVAFERGYI